MDMNTREEILNQALQYVQVDRNATYDEPERNFQRIADLANVALENAFDRGYLLPHEVGIFMVCVKLARIVTSPERDDHYIDGAGYFACSAECVREEPENPQGKGS